MIKKLLKNLIKDYADFPKKGIIFRDVLPILENPKVFKELIMEMSNNDIFSQCEAIIAIDARGFIFGTAIANYLSKPLILARKPNKLPGNLITKSYELEYGSDSLSVSKNSIKNFKNFVIVDDLIATGGTVKCVSEILKSENKNILGLSVVVELKELNGRKNFDFPVVSEIIY